MMTTGKERFSYLFDGKDDTVKTITSLVTMLAPFRWDVEVDEKCEASRLYVYDENDVLAFAVNRGEVFVLDVDFDNGLAKQYSVSPEDFAKDFAEKNGALDDAKKHDEDELSCIIADLIECCNDVLASLGDDEDE